MIFDILIIHVWELIMETEARRSAFFENDETQDLLKTFDDDPVNLAMPLIEVYKYFLFYWLVQICC